MWDEIADAAAAESTLWAEALLPRERQAREAVFSTLGPPTEAVGLETIYEGYLLHYGRPRLFSPPDADAALLLGDYLYAHGLVRIEVTKPEADVTTRADDVSRWVMAERTPIALPDARWDVMSYGIARCEAYLKRGLALRSSA